MFLTGLVNNHVPNRHKLTIIVELLVQAILPLVVAALLYAKVWDIDDTKDAYAIICLLSLCTGSQQITVKYWEVPEVNTTMVTIPIADILSDPHMLAPPSKNPHRNNRIAFIVVFMVGAILGGCCLHWVNAQLAIIISAGIKLLISFAIVFMPSEQARE